MSRAAVNGVRSVDLGVTELDARVEFYTSVWRLETVAHDAKVAYLRGTAWPHHVLALHARDQPALLRIDLTAPDTHAVDEIHAGLQRQGVRGLEAPAPIAEPGGGYGFGFRDPDGRTLRILAGSVQHDDAAPRADHPGKITLIVLNAPDPAAISAFYCHHLGFRIIDRTRHLTFLCCNSDHHSIAFARGERPTLHHIAFEMPDIDSVMRGAGRMRDHGYPIEWGVGRHGPGNNVFAYFVGPDEVVIEYTAEVEQVDDAYRVRGPEEWTWPPGRTDHWGIAVGPTPRLAAAQQRVDFASDLLRAAT